VSEQRTEVLIVGAGPVGLMTALMLAEADIDFELIDREPQPAARSYACALHPGSLKLLDHFGLLPRALEQGIRIEKMAFYLGSVREAELCISDLDKQFPFLLVMAQGALENLLQEALRAKARKSVNWNHRFDAIEGEDNLVEVEVERLEGTALGYVVPHWETMVAKRLTLLTKFLVGADGPNSLVRRRLGIDFENFGPAQNFVVCEFSSAAHSENEACVVLGDGTTSVLWPLPGGRYRWSFQLLHSEGTDEFPEKDRFTRPSAERGLNARLRGHFLRLMSHRAPWFERDMKDIEWCQHVTFQPRVAKQFGRGRCWLAGDAAHQTGPAGVQSLNAGLAEAAALTLRLEQILREESELDVLSGYDVECLQNWQSLLNRTGLLEPLPESPFPSRHVRSQILGCLPASGANLENALNQLRSLSPV
jgi:3-(3-hydroxy-phenyl)propionate hydroxylase